MINKRLIAAGFCFFLFFLPGFAQDRYAEISGGEGGSFDIVRGQIIETYSVRNANVIGVEINPGDMIKTYATTFLEIIVFPLSAAVHLAENTAFVFTDGASVNTSPGGELLYGRMRVLASAQPGSDFFYVTTNSLTAGVHESDFGVDVIPFQDTSIEGASSARSSAILYRVFCFEGSALVKTEIDGRADSLVIGKNEMIEKVVTEDRSYFNLGLSQLPTQLISHEVEVFWKVNSPFLYTYTSGTKLIPEPSSPLGFTAPQVWQEGDFTVSTRYWPSPEDTGGASIKRNKFASGAMIVALFALGSVSCALGNIWPVMVKNDPLVTEPLVINGWVMIGSGTILSLFTLFGR
ncbi:hypothetical protein K7I13_04305 [Brucepastera parasyntrophica]|uniref:hypothetical protein n=1 Tax=Brucepastera parasyntrophica TaxID=2880008 RepID=UPI00210DCE37|nr:hypothetical protein [Brucepastera parasyntrophica]ULQ60527.1 hypothetical protein K7I13_04305 [Brucepastera parasyntrophica]